MQTSISANSGLRRQAISFRDRLTEIERQALEDKGHWETYPTRAVIMREGEPGSALFIIEAGRVAAVTQAADGQPVVLAYRGPGETVGEIGVVGEQHTRMSSVVAIEDASLIRISADDLRELLTQYPGIGRAIMQVLTDRFQTAETGRVAALQEEQRLAARLAQATDEAERLAELARLRQDTVDLIVHDLRNPLGIVQGSLEMLLLALPPKARALPTVSEVTKLAQRNIARLMALTESLLDAARQEQSGIALKLEAVNLPALLQRIVSNLHDAAEHSDLALTLAPLPDLPALQADPAQLERLIVNLVDNAINYTPSGGRIVVSAVAVEGHVQVGVADTGVGVPPEHRRHIFERFGRVPDTQGRKRGFGLGLYFCRQVAEAHGGRIWVEPGPGGVGSMFAFTLPIN